MITRFDSIDRFLHPTFRPSLRLALACAVCLLALPATAEVRRLEAVGVVAVDPATKRASPPRDAAIQAALREGVERVALSLLAAQAGVAHAPDAMHSDALLEQAAPGGDANSAERRAVRRALGSKVSNYTARYRILEDRGEQPSLFLQDPVFDNEYQVIVAVDVDVARVRSQLAKEGLLRVREVRADLEGLSLDVRGLTDYSGLQALTALLLGAGGASEVRSVEFSPGRVLLDIQADTSDLELLARLQASPAPGLEIVPLVAGTPLVVEVRWDPAAAKLGEEDPLRLERAPGDGSRAKPPADSRDSRRRRAGSGRSAPGDVPASRKW